MMKAYFRSLQMSFATCLSLRESFLLQTLFMLGSNLILFSFWWIFFQHFEAVGGWGISEMACLYGIVSGSFGLFSLFFGGGKVLSRLIVDGDLDAILIRPKSPLLLLLGSKSLPSGWGDLLSALCFFLYAEALSWGKLPILLLLLALSAMVFAAFSILVGSLAFWVGEGKGLSKMLFDFLLVFSNYPEAVYEGPIRFALYTLIPSGLIGVMPVNLLLGFSWKGMLFLACSSFLYLFVSCRIFYFGLKRYTSANRFGFRI